MNIEEINQILEEVSESGIDIDGDVVFSNGNAYLVYGEIPVVEGCDCNGIF